MTQRLILGSTSKPRQALLQRLKIPFEIAAPDIDETPLPGEKAPDLVLRLAQQKAEIVAKNYPNALVIGADQVGVCGETILNKPLTHANAVTQLQAVSEQCVRFYIGLCLLNTSNQTRQVTLETYDVYFRKLTPKLIDYYLKNEAALNCAGSFKAEGLGVILVDKFQGDDFTALIGLPLARLTQMLEKAGYDFYHLTAII
jgi:septum formation protein